GSSRWPPISTAGAVCKESPHYRRKDHVFKLILGDSSQYLFSAPNKELQRRWVEELQGGAKPDSAPDTATQADRLKQEEEVTDGCQTAVSLKDHPQAESLLETEEKDDAGGVESSKADREPPPKPPHTYYNKHRYPEGGHTHSQLTEPASQSEPLPQDQTDFQRNLPPSNPPSPPPTAPAEGGAKERQKNKSMFKKLFKM
ncbi:hypothetical protein JZ751_012839, partial [Albula glossodonta]